MSNFKIATIILFLVFILLAIMMFTGILPGFKAPSGGYGGEVKLWGTDPEEILRPLFEQLNQENSETFSLVYREINEQDYEKKLTQALAEGEGPDLFFLSQDMIIQNSGKVYQIPFDVFTERDFSDKFIEEGELYITDDGILALPFSIDPIVMYWNRDMFSYAGISRAPSYWDEFLIIAPKLTKSDNAKNISKSAVSFGEFANVSNAKEVLSALFLQTGDKISIRKNGFLDMIFGEKISEIGSPAESALRFYTEFSNPSKPIYSWNRALPFSKDMFIAEDLAVYFGFASEIREIMAKNPHLNFAVAPLPQIRDSGKKMTFGDMEALAISKQSNNKQYAFQVAYILTDQGFISKYSDIFGLPPVLRELLSEKQTETEKSVFYESALMARGWLDPNPEASYNIFKDMVEGISSGRFRLSEAVLNAHSELEALVK